MTSEQVTELGQALEILSAKSSVLKERTELKKLIEENKESEEEVRFLSFESLLCRDYRITDYFFFFFNSINQGGVPNPLAKRLKGILSKIDKQLEEYDNEVGGRLNMFETDHEGKIAVKDLKSALEIIRHR